MNTEIIKLKEKFKNYSHIPWVEGIFSSINSKNNRNLDIRWEFSKKNNLRVPILNSNEKKKFLNSEYDPIVESKKILDTFEPCDFLLIIGIEGGYLAKCLCDYCHKFKRIIIIECIQELLIQTFALNELETVCSMANVSIHLIHSTSDLLPLISNLYQPQIYQSLRIFIKPSMSQLYRDLNINIEIECKNAVEAIHNDFVTQSRFAKRWLYNFLCNIRQLPYKELVKLPISNEIIIIGAGPSLDSQKNTIKKLSEQGIAIWAVDAALNWCGYNDVHVQAFLSIDGQSISYVHLLQDNLSHKNEEICAGDLLSNPIYFRRRSRLSPFISNHPLLHYYNNFANIFNNLNTDGGNVGQSLVALASCLGIYKMHVFGLDFAYLKGKPYSQPGFYFNDSIIRSFRTKPYELNINKLWLDNQLVDSSDQEIIQTERFGNYLSQFKLFLGKQDSEIVSYSKTWDSVACPSPLRNSIKFKPISIQDLQIANNFFVKSYLNDLNALKASNLSIQTIFESQYTREKQTFLTLMPLIAWYKAFLLKNDAQYSDISNRALSLSIEHTITRIREHFSSEELE